MTVYRETRICTTCHEPFQATGKLVRCKDCRHEARAAEAARVHGNLIAMYENRLTEARGRGFRARRLGETEELERVYAEVAHLRARIDALKAQRPTLI